MSRTTEYQQDLIKALKNSDEAAAYLNAAIEEGDHEIYGLAVSNVAAAKQKSYATLRAKMTPESRARSAKQTLAILQEMQAGNSVGKGQ